MAVMSQPAQRLHDVRAEAVFVGVGALGVVDTFVDRPAHVFQKAAKERADPPGRSGNLYPA